MGKKAELRRQTKVAEKKRNRRAAVFTILSLAVAFGSWAYFMLAATPSFHLGVALVLASAAFLSIAVCEFFESLLTKVMLVALVAGLAYFAFNWSKDQWQLKLQNDVVTHLNIKIDVPSGNPWDSIVTIANNSSSELSKHGITCKINRLRMENGSVYENVGSTIEWGGDAPLRIGGDAQSDTCLKGHYGSQENIFRGSAPVACADVTVVVNYSVNDYPEVVGQKKVRFVTLESGGHMSWNQQPEGRRGAGCP